MGDCKIVTISPISKAMISPDCKERQLYMIDCIILAKGGNHCAEFVSYASLSCRSLHSLSI